MYVCRNCGQAYTAFAPHCAKCGGEVIAVTPADPVAPTYSYNPKPARPKASGGVIFMGIVGFLFALESLFGFVFSFAIADATYNLHDEEFIAALMFGQIFVSILGLVFSSISRGKGFCGLAVAGKVISIIAIVVNAIVFTLLLLQGFAMSL